MSNSLDLQRLPCGETNFEKMIDGNLIYVDKTDLIFELTKIESSPILFTRPRRFGKSLLISVLNNLFRQRRQYFKGLKIEKLWQDTRTYKVLHLDFSAIASNDFGKFNRRFTDILKSFAKEYQLTYSEGLLNEPRAVLRELLSQCQNGEVVLLIDDYDLPLTSVGGESQSQKAIKECLISFFALLKALSSKFRFMFITGETRSFDMSILSAFNTILDLTLNKKYGTLLGFTKEELEHYFLAYIKRAASELDCTVDEVFYNLKLNYDGFCFEESASVLVYNPWSILNFLQLVSSSCGYKCYWANSSGYSTLIVNYFKDLSKLRRAHSYSLNMLSNNIDGTEVISKAKLESPSSILDKDPLLMMYQAGYYSIKSVDGNAVSIGIPNLELRQFIKNMFFDEIFLSNLESSDIIYLRKNADFKAIQKACLSKAEEDFFDIFDAVANTFGYDTTIFDVEANLRDILYSYFLYAHVNASREVLQQRGRSDLMIQMDGQRFVFELKLLKEQDNLEKVLEDATSQVLTRDYGKVAPILPLTRYVVVFSSPDKCLKKVVRVD